MFEHQSVESKRSDSALGHLLQRSRQDPGNCGPAREPEQDHRQLHRPAPAEAADGD